MSESPITQDEMIAMFGSEMPIEAVELLWSVPPDWTVGMIRAELRKIATTQTSGTARLKKLEAWVLGIVEKGHRVDPEILLHRLRQCISATELPASEKEPS